MPMPPEPPDRGDVARRDAGLRRVSRLTRWLLAGALALTAAFSAIAAHSFPGNASNQATNSTSTTLQSPASNPSASGGSGGVTSGGS